ncbi:hypothetical protein DDF62_19365 [Caulobacter radicis]|uniref:hypothetical protein n=1 Tax=Caulobacter radicis TaxID=2172650 RepID=UPI000D56B777|nr:hypothetical protein [Caulobacter radicis]PVM86312.1 hypothetical protein DDF62_19365 [Caulobacter radicis]
MSNAHSAPESSRKRRLALASLGAVAAIGLFAAREAFAPVCYWSGRLTMSLTSGGGHQLTPAAWLPENAPSWGAIGVAIGWLGLWAMTAFLVRRDARPWALTAPLILFLTVAWFTSRMVYACNIM